MAMVADSMGKPAQASALPAPIAVLQEFERAVALTPSIIVLLLSTADGRAIAEKSSLSADPRRVAAMTNSFLTLGETMAKELGLAAADHATVRTADGNVVLIRIEGPQPLTLAAVGKSDATLATLLFAARECASRIGALIPAASP